jgi:hypothetical protein
MVPTCDIFMELILIVIILIIKIVVLVLSAMGPIVHFIYFLYCNTASECSFVINATVRLACCGFKLTKSNWAFNFLAGWPGIFPMGQQ